MKPPCDRIEQPPRNIVGTHTENQKIRYAHTRGPTIRPWREINWHHILPLDKVPQLWIWASANGPSGDLLRRTVTWE